jgi:very-short-patch-repair endonuclease
MGLKPILEYKFHPERKFRADFCWPSERIILEYEGMFSRKSRHLTISGYKNDCCKYNEAQKLGYSVFRLTAIHVKNGQAAELLEWIKERVKGE